MREQLVRGKHPHRTLELATGHDPMISAPRELTEVLLGCLS
jgi:hypothetical protein